jgi:pimeloyl-ACP methyl ester carboxylesterase
MQVQVNGITLGYEEQGSGMPVLLIHGYPLNRRMWQPQITGLSGDARVLAVDLRGCGESQATAGPYSMDLLADDCAGLLDAVGVTEQIVLCGLSMGGYVAMAFRRKYAERLAGLILVATRAGADTPEGKAGREQAAALAQREGPTEIAKSMLPKLLAPKSYETQPKLVEYVKEIIQTCSIEGLVGDLLGMKDRPDSMPSLMTIQGPTLIVHGADDQIIPVKEAEAMRDAIPNALLQIIPESGHLVNLEQPDLFNQTVSSYLKSI